VEGRFCGKCGASVPAAAGPPPAAGPIPPIQPPPAYNAYGATPPPPVAAAGMQENVAGALCYLVGLITGILFLVLQPYNQNPRIRFHAFQSIFFHVFWIVLWIALTAISFALPWELHLIVSLLHLVVWLGGFILWLLLMWKAYNNERLVLPIIGPIAEQQASKGVPAA